MSRDPKAQLVEERARALPAGGLGEWVRHLPKARATVALGLLALVAVPWVVRDPYLLHMVNMALIFILVASSLNLLVGYAGRLNLGYAAFYGVGAYTSAILTVKLGWPFWLTLPLGGLASLAVGLIIGVPCLRLKGPYLAIATLSFGEITRIIAHNWDAVTNGPLGMRGIPAPTPIPIPGLGTLTFASKTNYYYLLLVVVLLCLWGIRRLVQSQLGRCFEALREDDILAEHVGINTVWAKLVNYAVSAFFAGIAGVLYAHYIRYVSPETLSVGESFTMVAMVVVGGMGTFAGPIVGAILFTWLPEILRVAASYRMVIYGAIMMLSILFMRSGLVGAYTSLVERWQRRREGRTP